MNLRYRLLLLYLRLFRRPALRSKKRLYARIRSDAEIRNAPSAAIQNTLNAKRHRIAGVEVWSLSPKLAHEGQRAQVMYLHGGAFVFGITPHHWKFIARLVKVTGVTVHVVLYPRAPSCQHTETLTSIEVVYASLCVANPEGAMLLMGDSAGATLCLLLSSRVGRQADGMVLMSPCADMSLASPEVSEMESRDPWLTVEGLRNAFALWLGRTSCLDPAVNPMTCDLSRLPPTHLFIGDRDVFWPDCMRLANKLQRQGREIHLHLGEDMCHTWPLLPMPEARATQQHIHALLFALQSIDAS